MLTRHSTHAQCQMRGFRANEGTMKEMIYYMGLAGDASGVSEYYERYIERVRASRLRAPWLCPAPCLLSKAARAASPSTRAGRGAAILA